ncbi:hypothetical protein ATANTOWER_019843 [Ataeniobius toweri]|uniref:Ig-like domain-containing protein n=1 Tax=Ataeniobius toweri TaxID=208326 RepID=A0ABU7BUT9_9TELE|nr:hypothetical protein [Ataeniobius toweri]
MRKSPAPSSTRLSTEARHGFPTPNPVPVPVPEGFMEESPPHPDPVPSSVPEGSQAEPPSHSVPVREGLVDGLPPLLAPVPGPVLEGSEDELSPSLVPVLEEFMEALSSLPVPVPEGCEDAPSPPAVSWRLRVGSPGPAAGRQIIGSYVTCLLSPFVAGPLIAGSAEDGPLIAGSARDGLRAGRLNSRSAGDSLRAGLNSCPPFEAPSGHPGVMGEYEPKIEVQFPEVVPVAKSSTVKLECFALGNPVPTISWKREDGAPFGRKVDMNKASGVLEIPYFQQEDSGMYECMAENSRGRNSVKGKLSFYAPPQLTEKPQDVQKTIDDTLVWECKANAKPKPSYGWLKNGEPLDHMEQDRVQVNNGVLTISNLNLADIGMYQCVAENKHGRIFTNAELRVIAIAPDFSQNLLKAQTLARQGGDILIECKPRMSPRGVISWRKGKEALRESHRCQVTFCGAVG